MKCDTTADVDAAFIYTNAVLAFFSSTGGKESDAVASTSDFKATNGKGKIDKTVAVLPAPLLVKHVLRNFL